MNGPVRGIVTGVVRVLGMFLELLTGSIPELLTDLRRRREVTDTASLVTAPPGPVQEVPGDPPRPESRQLGLKRP